jgi:RimJ/RimL family protein N-acetyltransferase
LKLIDETISLYDATIHDLAEICKMEQGDARHFIMPYSLQRHQEEFGKPHVHYKLIRRSGKLNGFLILALDPDGQSVELHRIVVAEPGHGVGKQVLKIVRELCRTEFGRRRVWLDVFETNARARHVYEECGFRPFGTSKLEGRILLLYETTA